jgi:hypothetical protein
MLCLGVPLPLVMGVIFPLSQLIVEESDADEGSSFF